MSEIWTASMNGVPWTHQKMEQAVAQLRHRATVSYVAGSDREEDLLELDRRVLARRPDLILQVSIPQDQEALAEHCLETLAGLQHVRALQLHLRRRYDLSRLTALKRLRFLVLRADKPLNLDFVGSFKQLSYLALSGKCDDLAPIGDCIRLTTLILSVPVERLDWLARLPQLDYLALDSCTLQAPLTELADTNLSMLRLSSVRNLTELQGLEALERLISLQLSLPKVERLCDFAGLRGLRQLELDYMKSLRDMEGLWRAPALETLMLKDISGAIPPASWTGLLGLESLRQVDFRFMGGAKSRIAAIHQMLREADKAHLAVDHIPEEERVQSIALAHLASVLT